MAYSSSQGKALFKEWLIDFMVVGNINTILDVGPGCGTYGKLVIEALNEVRKYKEDKTLLLDAVEIFYQYIVEFGLEKTYNRVFLGDIRDFVFTMPDYDLVILGDVLEHLEVDEAKTVFLELKKKTKFIWVSIPCKVEGKRWSYGYHQLPHEWEVNPAERHTHEWTLSEIESILGPFTWKVPYSVVAVFIAEGDRD